MGAVGLRELGSALSLARTLHSFIGVVVGFVPPSLPSSLPSLPNIVYVSQPTA